jgi:hypothetical protein
MLSLNSLSLNSNFQPKKHRCQLHFIDLKKKNLEMSLSERELERSSSFFVRA